MNTVSLHPYFKAHEGKLDAFRALLPQFIERTATEETCLFYDFSICGDEIYCREAYIGGEGVQAHLSNVGDLIQQALQISDLVRLEVHGPAGELEKLKPDLDPLGARWFVFAGGLDRCGRP
ncbi:MAG: hypothetical protein R3F11_19755 [Verrucomicrobiales bacterium]